MGSAAARGKRGGFRLLSRRRSFVNNRYFCPDSAVYRCRRPLSAGRSGRWTRPGKRARSRVVFALAHERMQTEVELYVDHIFIYGHRNKAHFCLFSRREGAQILIYRAVDGNTKGSIKGTGNSQQGTGKAAHESLQPRQRLRSRDKNEAQYSGKPCSGGNLPPRHFISVWGTMAANCRDTKLVL